MKSILLLLVTAFVTHAALAQLTVTTGAQFAMTGPVQLTLQNTSLIINGGFAAGTSSVSFTGNSPSSIGGAQAIQFGELEINKSNGSSVQLQRAIAVSQRILFTAGFLNLNGFNTDLGTTGILQNESQTARFTGPNGGEVFFNVNLNAPLAENPANLGLFITSPQNLGNVTIRRGHKSQVNNAGGANSILRYYEIIPANNTALDAALTFSYFDAELNNLTENDLLLFESSDAATWTNLGFTTRDLNGNFLSKTGIGTLARFSLFSSSIPLPVHFVSINAKCKEDKVLVAWKTAQEANIQRYSIERSEDGNTWTAIGELPPSGTGAAEKSYTYSDNAPLQNGYYRIAEYDLNGTMHYSSAIRTSCAPSDVFSVFPNPVSNKLFIKITAAGNSTALIQLFDSKGRMVKQRAENIMRNANLLIVDMTGLAKGIYHLSVEWNNGQVRKTSQVMKN
jgi:Secretion system C-terminal sorting domain